MHRERSTTAARPARAALLLLVPLLLLPAACSRLAVDMQGLSGRVEKLEAAENARTEAKENEAGQLAERLQEIEAAIGELRTRQAALEERLGKLSAETARNSERLGSLPGQGPLPSPQAAAQARSEIDEAQELLTQGKYGEARKKLALILSAPASPAIVPRVHLLKGESLFQEKNYQEAILSFHKVVEEFPKSPEAPRALYQEATCFGLTGKQQNATYLFQKLLSEYPQSPEAAQVRKDLEDLDKAKK